MRKHHIAKDVNLKHPQLSCTSTPAWSDVHVAHGPDVRQLGCWPALAAAHVGAPCRECSTLQATGTKTMVPASAPHESGLGKHLDQCLP